MILREFIWKVLKEDFDTQVANLKNKYVGEGKPISEEEFKMILDVSLGKNYLMHWLTKKVGTGVIKNEDIYKWKEYFEIFEKNKSKFDKKDIALYKTPQDVQDFISNVIKIREAGIGKEEIPVSDKYVSANDIEKLESSGGIKYLGMWTDYQVFRIWDPSEKTWKLYRDILGRCKGRAKGAKIELCTIGRFDYFQDYLRGRGLKDYILLFNMNDPLSPYQLHVKSYQFLNKNDVEEFNFRPSSFLSWLEKKAPEYLMKKVAPKVLHFSPHKDKGYYDENGEEQGLFEYYDDNRYFRGIFTFKDGKFDGPFVKYHKGISSYGRSGGNISEKGNYRDDLYDGPYASYTLYGFTKYKGTYEEGNKIGVWRIPFDKGHSLELNLGYRRDEITHALLDYGNGSFFPKTISGMSGNDLAFVCGYDIDETPKGKIVNFYPDKSIRSIGNLTSKGLPTGKWIVHNPDGTVKSEGVMKKGIKVKTWTEYFKYRNKKYKFVIERGETMYDEPLGFRYKLYDENEKLVKGTTKEMIAKAFTKKYLGGVV